MGLGEAIYLASGSRKRQKGSGLQYVGISNDPRSRFSGQHHKLPEITRNFAVWVGLVVSQARSGRRGKSRSLRHSTMVDRAEWAMAYLLMLPLNVRKRAKPPPEPLTV